MSLTNNEKIAVVVEFNRLTERAAIAAYDSFGINPFNVLYFDFFGMTFFENTPSVKDPHNWIYARSSGSHSSLIFNRKTSEVRLVANWDDANLKDHQENAVKDIKNFRKGYRLAEAAYFKALIKFGMEKRRPTAIHKVLENLKESLDFASDVLIKI